MGKNFRFCCIFNALGRKAGSPSRKRGFVGNQGFGVDQPPLAPNGILRRPSDSLSNLFARWAA